MLKFLQEILLTTSLNSIAVSILGQFVKDLSGLRKAKRWCCTLYDDTMNLAFVLPFRLVHYSNLSVLWLDPVYQTSLYNTADFSHL